jgi:hypothetical protein
MEITIQTGKDLQRVTKNLAAMGDGKLVRRRLTKEIRAEVRPVVAQVKAAYRSGPSRNQPNPKGRGDLRPMLARAVTMQIRTGGRNPGVTIKVDGRKMPDHMGGVPRMYEGRERWRHPSFGNRNRWVTQKSVPTFDRIVPRAAAGVRRRVNHMAEDIARDVAKGRVSSSG